MTNTEEEDIKKIGRFLEMGATMLASHCQCGAPMFRYQGQIICPVCESKKPEAEEGITKKVKPRGVKEAVLEREREPIQGMVKEIEKGLIEKIIKIGEDMERETDLSRVRDQMECIEIGIRILKQLE